MGMSVFPLNPTQVVRACCRPPSPARKGLETSFLREQLQRRPGASEVPTGDSRTSECEVANSPWRNREESGWKGLETPEQNVRSQRRCLGTCAPQCPPHTDPKAVRPGTQFPSLGWADATVLDAYWAWEGTAFPETAPVSK